MSDRSRHPRTLACWKLVIALPLFLLLAYASFSPGCFPGCYVYDDIPTIRDNRALHSPVTAFMRQSLPDPSAFSGRPMVSLSFAVEQLFLPFSPGYLRLTSVFLQAVGGWLLLAFFHELGRRIGWRSPALIASASALIWMTHPIHCQAVLYLTQRSTLLMGICFFLVLLAGLRRRPKGPLGHRVPSTKRSCRLWSVVGIAACWAGAASKEVMVVAPLAVILLDMALAGGGRRKLGRLFERNGRFYLGLFSSWIYILWLLLFRPASMTITFGGAVSPWEFLQAQSTILFSYLRTLFWPDRIIFDYGAFRPSEDAFFFLPMLAWAFVLLVAGRLLLCSQKLGGRLVGLALLFFLLTLAPTSSFLPNLSELGAERRMWLPSAALVLLACGLFARLCVRLKGVPQLCGWVTLACMTGLMVSTTRGHARPFRSELELWAVAAKSRPESNRAQAGLALAHQRAGDVVEADALVKDLTEREGLDHFDHLALAKYHAQAGQWERALFHQREGLDRLRKAYRKPTFTEVSETENLIALLVKSEANYARAFELASEAQLRFPDRKSLERLHAITCLKSGRGREGIGLIESLVLKYPSDPQFPTMLEDARRLMDAQKPSTRRSEGEVLQK